MQRLVTIDPNDIQDHPKNDQLESIFSYKYWRHHIDLGGGLVTPGYTTLNKWDKMQLPESLTGKSFADVGSNDGMYCFEAERRGAERLMGFDLYTDDVVPSSAGTGWPNKGIRLAKGFLESKVEFESRSIYELSGAGRSFDVVYCSDVFAWLDRPEDALVGLSSITKEKLIIHDAFFKGGGEDPVLHYDSSSNQTDYRANPSFVREVLSKNGFSRIEIHPLEFSLEKFMQFPVVSIPKGAPAYQTYKGADSGQFAEKDMNLLTPVRIGDMVYVMKYGWFDLNDVDLQDPSPKMLAKLVKGVLGEGNYLKIKSKLAIKNSKIAPYVIVGHR